METFFKIKSRFGEFSNYKISRTGNILCWNYKQGNITGIIKQFEHNDGYYMISLTDDNKVKHTM